MASLKQGNSTLSTQVAHNLILQVAAGRKWPQVAASGRKWPQVAASGRKWPQVAASGRMVKWPQVAASGRKWPQHLATRFTENSSKFPWPDGGK